MSIPLGIRRDKDLTVSALFAVGMIQIAMVGFTWMIYGDQLSFRQMRFLDQVITLSGGIYLVLAIAARWLPVPAALGGAVLYAGFLAFQASRSVDLLMSGLIFKIPIVLLLVMAVVSAFRRSPVTAARESAQHGTAHEPPPIIAPGGCGGLGGGGR